jgi:hypothetical protein
MSDLGRILEVLHGSGGWQTLSAEYRVWTHRDRSREAWDTLGGVADWTGYLSPSGEDLGPEETEEIWRIWVAKPDRMGQETEGGLNVDPRPDSSEPRPGREADNLEESSSMSRPAKQSASCLPPSWPRSSKPALLTSP